MAPVAGASFAQAFANGVVPAAPLPKSRSALAMNSAPAAGSVPLQARMTLAHPMAEKPVAAKPALVKPVMAKPVAAVDEDAPVSAASQLVQVGAFSIKANAAKVAQKVGGKLVSAGNLWRVRMGPYSGRGEAESALAKAKSAGYSDARIQHAD